MPGGGGDLAPGVPRCGGVGVLHVPGVASRRRRLERRLEALLTREWTAAEVLAEKPRGTVLHRSPGGQLYEAFICHGCQTCWDVDPVTDELNEAYPHFLSWKLLVEVTV